MNSHSEEKKYREYGPAYRYEKNGWTYVHIEGEPFERGKQYGFLVKDNFEKTLNVTKRMTLHTMGVEYDYLAGKAVELTQGKIPQELLDEMRGFAAGLSEAGFKSDINDIIGWNAYPDMSYWWGAYGKDAYIQNGFKRAGLPVNNYGVTIKKPPRHGHCSAFVATGSATADGKMVIGHETFADYWMGGQINVILDLKPTAGARILMQTAPGYVWSNSDFFICKSEQEKSCIAGLETTIIITTTYVIDAIPEWVRARKAMQYGYSIGAWIDIMQDGNNGSNPGAWLLADANTNEIVRFEQGYLFQSVEYKKDGYIFGCNCVEDPRIRNLECIDVGYDDIRRQTGGRRTRWSQLLSEHNGRIDAEVGKIMLADTIDVYAQQMGEPDFDKGGANTICAMYDKDPRRDFSSQSGVWPEPYSPGGSMDGKVTTSDWAKEMRMDAIWGRANGEAFDADAFLKKHPQWEWQRGCIETRPEQKAWTTFQVQR